MDREAAGLARRTADVGSGGGEIETATVDVGSPDDVQRAMRECARLWGGIQALFNTAGIEGMLVPMEQSTIEDYDAVFHVNARGVWLSMKYVLPYMVAAGGGAIVNTGSYQSLHRPPNCKGPFA